MRAFLTDKLHGRVLLATGIVGLIAALAVGVGGWILAGGVVGALDETLASASRTLDGIDDTIGATLETVSRTGDAIETIENATRTTARTLETVDQLLGEAGEVATKDVADGLESAVQALPGLIQTGTVIDRSLRALRLLGVDYDPVVPLDEALTDMEQSLAPIPGKLRDQAVLLEAVRSHLADMTTEAGALAGDLLEVRLGLAEAGRVLAEASRNAERAAAAADDLESNLPAYARLAQWLAVAAAAALATPVLASLYVHLPSQSDARRRDLGVSGEPEQP